MAVVYLPTADLVDRSEGALAGLALGDLLGQRGHGQPQQWLRGRYGWIDELQTTPGGACEGARLSSPACEFPATSTMSAATHSALKLALHWQPWQAAATSPRRYPPKRRGTSTIAHRLLPIGLAVRWPDDIAAAVCRLAPERATHPALAGAALISGIISSALDAPRGATGAHFVPAHLEMGIQAAEEVRRPRGDTSPSLIQRCLLAREIAMRASGPDEFLRDVYEILGSARSAIEAVPAAVAIFLKAGADPEKAAVLGANLGGQSCRIAGLATAMAGAVHGTISLPQDWLRHQGAWDQARAHAAASHTAQLRA